MLSLARRGYLARKPDPALVMHSPSLDSVLCYPGKFYIFLFWGRGRALNSPPPTKPHDIYINSQPRHSCIREIFLDGFPGEGVGGRALLATLECVLDVGDQVFEYPFIIH